MRALSPTDARGVLPLLLLVSGYAAMERGSESIELQDLIKAIYVADLEHVAECWDDWQGFEKLVAGSGCDYLNRTLYLLQVYLSTRQTAGGETEAVDFAKVSPTLVEVIAAARKLASHKTGVAVTPSSRQILFSACSLDQDLSQTLQRAGLNLPKLQPTL